jgi:hypothetical protein
MKLATWMAAHVLGLDPEIEEAAMTMSGKPGHYNKDTL